jgi:hypothetical protein
MANKGILVGKTQTRLSVDARAQKFACCGSEHAEAVSGQFVKIAACVYLSIGTASRIAPTTKEKAGTQ